MNLESVIFLVLAGGAFSFSGWRLSQLVKLMKAQKGNDRPLKAALKDLPARLQTTLVNVLGQKAVLKKPAAGFMHTAIFWGFIIITIGTIEQFVSTLFVGANFEFIGEGPYRAVVYLQDVFATLVIAGVAYAYYRRLVIRPPHLKPSTDALWILFFTGALMVSIFLMNGFSMLAHEHFYFSAMPISGLISSWLSAFGFDSETNAFFAKSFKWIHMLIVLGFSMYIPGSKHLHIIAAGPNTFFKTLTREKGMTPIRFEDESITQYGAAKVTDLNWKDTLDMYSCTECGRCQEVCPAWNTQKPLSPMKLVNDLKYNLFANKEKIFAGKFDEVTAAVDKNVTEDVLWSCTSCRACEIACPVFIEHTDKIYSLRRNLVLMESKFPTEVQTVFKNMETNGTPWAFSASDRDQWASDLNIPRLADVKEVDILLWVGCAGSFDDRNKKIVRSFVSLLQKAKISFAILGKEEQCTGDPARRIGNEYLYSTLAQANVETLNRYKFNRVVTTCPHCFNTIKNEYKDLGGVYDVRHHTQLLAELVREGKLKPSQAREEEITFHDSCYLGRWNGEYDSPREVLKSVAKKEILEMESTGEKSLCCGAGGGRMWMEENLGTRINVKRTEQALATGAKTIASGCPFCVTMLSDGLKAKEMSGNVRVLDVAEILDEAT